MEVATSSIRLIGAPRMRNGRKMSGLGIVFSEASTPDSPTYHWEDDLPDEPSFTYEGPVTRSSRWSESTQQSRATKTTSTNSKSNSARISQNNSIASRSPGQLAAVELAYVSNIVIKKRPSVVEVQAFIDGKHDQRSARGSDDSQNSHGPVTPLDEGYDKQIRLGAFENFGETPRKAPAPPMISSEISADFTSRLARRPSLTQSMMRTLGGRKNQTRPPPPLHIVPPMPLITALPPNYDVPTIIHHLERPMPKRSGTTVSDTTNSRKSPTATTNSFSRPTSSSGRRTSGSSFNTLFRNVRNTISRKSSKASPLLESVGKMSVSRSPVPSLKSNAPSFVNIQVETSTQIQSTPSSPDVDRRAALRAIRPASKAGKAGSRPSTAPAGGRGDFGLQPQIPLYTGIQSKVSSPATVFVPTMGEEVTATSFDIQYRDPWKKTSGFVAASEYSQTQALPPSPPSWLISHQAVVAGGSKSTHKQGTPSPRGAGLLAVPPKVPGGRYASSSNSVSSASPTSVPSWTPMLALPSPNVSILQTPPRSFLDLEASPSSAPRPFGLSGDPKKLVKSASAEIKAAYLYTPGHISMRDPWAKSQDPAERAPRREQGPDGLELENDEADASRYTTSNAGPSKSPEFNFNARSRRPSRKAVPRIEEDECIASASSPDHSGRRASEVYAGCRPFHRPSVDEQLSDMIQFKNPFLTRLSLADVREGQVDTTARDIFGSEKLAGRNFSTSTSESMRQPPPHKSRPSYPVFESNYSIRRPSYASEKSNQSFPSKPTRFEFSRRPTLAHSDGIRVSFDSGIML